jgi:hypothetical protein
MGCTARRSLDARVPEAVAAILVLASVAVMAPGTASAGAKTRPNAAAVDSTISFDERRGTHGLTVVVGDVQDSCSFSDHVTVTVNERSWDLTTTFNCVAVRGGSAATITNRLVTAAGKQNRAAEKADRVVALQNALPPTAGLSYDRDTMIWNFAARKALTCQRAGRPKDISANMAVGAQSSGETPEHWTLIEAVLIAGACPRQLPVLFRNVKRIGQPDAATAVARLLRQAASHPKSN